MAERSRDGSETKLIEEPGGGISLRLRGIRIVVLDGPDRGREVTPQRHLVRVGTHPGADLTLSDATVSREHCLLTVRDEGIRVVDRGSTNGTFVDGTRIHDAEIAPGAHLRVGQTTLRVTTSDETLRIELSTRDEFGALKGRSPRMRELFAILERVAPTDATVLLEGESGTGKELAAEGLHDASTRSEEAFVVFDCGAVPHELAEGALFGHVRGAFTGAVADHRGVFEEADGGTIFLDEIGDLPTDLQPKLLRVLEKREIRRVGSDTTHPVDVRVVAATNRSLEAEVNAGRFREDLYYRLAVVKIAMPPLRARTEDLPMLVEHFLRKLTPPGSGPPEISPQILMALSARSWPGNVRELRNVVERAVSLSGFDALMPGRAGPKRAESMPEELLAPPYSEARERFERQYFEAALRRSGGNVSGAAREVGVNRKYIHRLLRRQSTSSDEE